MRWPSVLCASLLVPAIHAASLPVGTPEQVGMSTERLKRLSAAMQGYIDRGEVAGMVTVVARRGRIVHLEAQGLMNVNSKAAMRSDALFHIASMTKPISSVAVMTLIEEGRLHLNDPVSKYIPEFKNPKVKVVNPPGASRDGTVLVPALREITVEDLLTHTAGLATTTSVSVQPELDKFMKERAPQETLADSVKKFARLPLNFQPGAAWEYGLATDVLGYLVEVVSGTTFDKFLSERIFRPLEMNDTCFYVADEKLSRLATVYASLGPLGLQAVKPAEEMRGSQVYFSGAGGLLSTAGDYARFCQMLANGGTLSGTRLLSRKTIELMTVNHIGDLPLWPDLAGFRYGLGFGVLYDPGKASRLVSKGTYSWGGMYGTYFFVDPKEETFGILMVQLLNPGRLNIQLDLQNLVMQAITD